MAQATPHLLYEEEYRIEKRADGTEDFHCTFTSCAGVFSYRTLRALNNHRAASHSLPAIPKRKRGPKKRESSRQRHRSADAIKRQVMKRAMDISKREQGCRSMARLRASRLAIVQAAKQVDTERVTVVQAVDKLLQNWEGAGSQRRSLLERRIQMARLEWAMKGEALPLSTIGEDSLMVRGKDDEPCYHANGSEDVEGSEGLPGMLARDYPAKERESDRNIQPEGGLLGQMCSATDDLAESSVAHASEMVETGDGNFCEIEVGINGEKGFMRDLTSNDNFEGNQLWQNCSISKSIGVNQHEMRSLNESFLAEQANEFMPCFCRNRVLLEYGDTRRF